MKETHKKLWTFALLLIVAAPIFFYAGFLIKQSIIQHAMLERLESSALQTISINNKDVKWEKVNKELILHGVLFDVKSIIVKSDSIIVTGLYDVDEKKLKDDLVSCLNQKKDSSAPFEKLLFKFIFTTVLINDAYSANQLNSLVKPFFYHFKEFLYTNTITVFSPPPKVWFCC